MSAEPAAPPPRLTEQLAYHDYVAVVSYLEEPNTIRRQNQGGINSTINREVTRWCAEYRDKVNANAKAYAAAAGQLDDFLFNPVHWVAFGRSDSVTFTLFDDLDPAVNLMGLVDAPAVQACLAFCPKTDPMSLGLDSPAERWPFDQPKDWAAGPAAAAPEFHPALHPVQDAAPLLVAGRFKIGGLTALGGGAAFFQAVLRTLARQVVDELDSLDRGAEAGDERVAALEITREAVAATRCLVLDGQGSEDLILLVACSNYSVGVGLVARLRCMTMGDLFATDAEIPRQFQRGFGAKNGALHVRVLEYYEKGSDVRAGWAANHVFSDSHTTLGATRAAFDNPAAVGGYATVVAQIDANAGHELEVEDVLEKTFATVRGADGQPLQRTEVGGGPHRFLVGRHDYLEVIGDDPAAPLRALRTADFLRYLAEFVRQATRAHPDAPGDETGFMHFSSSIVLPFPRLGQIRPVDRLTHLPAMDLLDCVRRGLFEDDGSGPRLTLSRLEECRHRLRMPWSLYGAVERLYQTFASHLADPYLFDSVLDLYDAFAALYGLLTTDLLKSLGQDQATPFGQWLTTRLDGLLEAIKNATDHRVRLMLPNADMRDTAVDLLGGLSKLVAAADVPFKCGLYLVNQSLSRAAEEGSGVLHGVPLDRVGGVARIGFNPQTLCDRMTFPEDRRFLAYVRMDVLHVTRPLRFLAHIHEATHLLYGVGGPVAGEGEPPANDDLREEVFVELLSHLIVFGADTGLFLRRYVADYSVLPIGYGSARQFADTPAEAHARFFLLLLRAFFVTRPIEMMNGSTAGGGAAPPGGWPKTPPLDVFADPRAHEDAFLTMVKTYGPFYAPFADWWADPDTEKVWRVVYRRDALAHARFARPAWEKAYARFQQLTAPVVAPTEQDAVVRRALAEGRPFTRLLGAVDRDQALETVQLVCRLLYFHSQFCYGGLDPTLGLHLHRDAAGKVCFAGPQGRPLVGWNRFQLDAMFGGLFCADPAARRERVLQQVVVLKSLWDVSSYIRAERFEQILGALPRR